jgi:hypothetical protein
VVGFGLLRWRWRLMKEGGRASFEERRHLI